LTSATIATQLLVPQSIPIRFSNGVASANYAIKSDTTNGLQFVESTESFVPFRLNAGSVFMLDVSGGVLKFNISGATSGATMSLTSNHTTNRTLTLPDATDTVVARNTAEFLTNKGLEDSCYFTNHTNHNLKLGLLASTSATQTLNYIQATGTATGIIHVIPTSSVNNNFVMTQVDSASQTISGLLTLGTGLKLPTSTGTPAQLDYYETYVGSGMVATGPVNVAPSCNVRITRIGDIVHCELPAIAVNTCNNATFYSVTALPSRFWPARNTNQECMNVFNNNINVFGYCTVSTAGVIQIYSGLNAAVFTAGNFCATYGKTLTWKTT
jgi:hypothetical protein